MGIYSFGQTKSPLRFFVFLETQENGLTDCESPAGSLCALLLKSVKFAWWSPLNRPQICLNSAHMKIQVVAESWHRQVQLPKWINSQFVNMNSMVAFCNVRLTPTDLTIYDWLWAILHSRDWSNDLVCLIASLGWSHYIMRWLRGMKKRSVIFSSVRYKGAYS